MAALKVSAGAVVLQVESEDLTSAESVSKLTHLAIRRIQFLEGLRPPLVSCHMGRSIGQFTICQLASSEQAYEKSQRKFQQDKSHSHIT